MCPPHWEWRDGSVSEVLAMQITEPGFGTQHLHKTLGVVLLCGEVTTGKWV